jgi:hypothetical protein
VLFSKRRDYTIGIGDKNLRFLPRLELFAKTKIISSLLQISPENIQG